jgi:metal-responsive CopG/Arc/MetJ family transcriptional regulator
MVIMAYTQLLHFRISPHLLKVLDEQACNSFVRRSEYIRQAIVEKIRKEQGINGGSEPIETILLLTDGQLEDLRDAVVSERHRRQATKHLSRRKYYQ